MNLRMYSIRDSKAAIFHPPFFNQTHGEAERNFAQLAADPKSTIAQFPEDFDLYYLGIYDNNTGKMETLDSPEHMIKAINTQKPGA